MIPSSLLSEEPYRELPGESKLLYGHLLGLLRLSAQDTTGHWKANGRPCVSLSRASAGRLLHCQREKAAGLFAGAGAGTAKRKGPAVLPQSAPAQGTQRAVTTRRNFRSDLSEKWTGS